MGIYIALGLASVIAIAIGIALAKAKETQLWYILSIISMKTGSMCICGLGMSYKCRNNSYDCIYNKLCNIS